MFRRRRLFVAALLLAANAPASGAPWLAAGDEELRQDIELLSAAGRISGPINAWPMPAAQVCSGDASPSAAPIAAAARRVAAACDAARRPAAEARFSLTTEPVLIRGFATAARSDADASVALSRDIGRLHLRIGVGVRDDDVHIEPSYAMLDLGGWALYGGYVEHWWGPGHENALLLSTNARPFPQIGIRRTAPRPIDLPILRWLGPVGAEVFTGILTEDRNDFDNPAIIGMRVAFAPAPGLEIGLNRALQVCGTGRPCDFGTLTDALIAFGNRDNTGTPNEAGNQLAGVDLSYRRMIGPVGAHIYAEAAAEDENNVLIEQFARLAGVALTGPAGSDGATWALHVEAVDTLAVKLFGSKRYPGSFYNHFIYTDGFRYHRRALGSSLDGDGRMLAVAGALTDAEDRRFYASWRRVSLNRSGSIRNPLIVVPARFGQLAAGVDLPALSGRLRLEARVTDHDLNAADLVPRGQIEMTFTLAR